MSNFKFTESDFENAILDLFTKQNYFYACGYDMHRLNSDIIIVEDFIKYLQSSYSDLCLDENEIKLILHNLTLSTSASTYINMKQKLSIIREGFNLERKNNKIKSHIDYLNFKEPEKNIFKVINQYEVRDAETRRPDVIVFINGIPVSVIELKNVANEVITLNDAYTQLHVRYERDISSLMQYSFLSVISDGANTKVGSLFADYDHFFFWKSTNGFNYANDGIESVFSMINGLFEKHTLLNVIHNYIYFPDKSDKELMVVPKYSQYYASELLYQNIKQHLKPVGDGKGGTYFGATGCGKSYTMLFLARRISQDIGLNNPTIIMLTDRTDLDDQLSATFEDSKQYLIDNNTMQVASRKVLLDKLKGVSSGGIYLLTVQKFDDDVNLLSARNNIICISDEAHRTQVNLDQTVTVTEDDVKVHYGFAKYLRDSFPNATYVGFTGTPIDATISVFGDIVCSYKMAQSVADHSTVGIRLLPGPSSVRLDDTKLAIIDRYYRDQIDIGANKYQVEESKKQMATVRTIINNDKRLDKVVSHLINHYEKRVEEGSTVCGKAMIVCYDRTVAYKVYKKIVELRPEWSIKRKTVLDENELTKNELDKLIPIEMIRFVATRNKDDEKDMYNLLGSNEDRKDLSILFKNKNSNFKLVIVVDMWVTGFDCECLDTMYVDKPLEKHTLIQTISRVNRVFEGKEDGLIVDYIGMESALAKAMQMYSNDINPVNEVEGSYIIFKDQLKLINYLMNGFNVEKFLNGTSVEKLECLNKGVEFVQFKKENETRFMGLVKRLKSAYDICVGDERIINEEVGRTHFYIAIRAIIYKMSGDSTPDVTQMNKEVKNLVDACITVINDEQDRDIQITDIFSDEYLKKIEGVPYKNTKFKMLIELLRRAIKQYGKSNKLKELEFSEKMRKIVDKYNNRDAQILVSNDDIINDFIDNLADEAKKLLGELEKDANSFSRIGITFEEKAFYDILIAIRDKYKFEYTEEKIITLSKKVKSVIDDKAKYTDWWSRNDIKASLQSDIIRLLNRNGYPPVTFEDVYKQVIEQAENLKKYLN